MPSVRTLLVLVSCVLLAGCSSGGSRESGQTPSPKDASTSAPSSLAPPASVDPCDLLTDLQVEKLAGGSVGAARPGLTGGVANCQWAAAEGSFVQAIGAPSSAWAESLPENLRAIEASGQFTDSANMRKLRKAAELVEGGQDPSPVQACSLFSDLLELQGQPRGTHRIVTVIPTRAAPQGVTGQWCSRGRFTSVLVGNQKGLEKPLPVQMVAHALNSAHRRNLG